MLEARCSGTPFEIGNQHGSQAREQVYGSLSFYKALFKKACDLDWSAVRAEATKFLPTLEAAHSRYVDEMRGVASGAGVDLLDILALNVRTEITFGLFTTEDAQDEKVITDGCTAFAYTPGASQGSRSFLAQNWDWQAEQLPNLFVCYISQPNTGLPDIAMITEGGIIGKIGLNSRGVGVCLNAIRARGVDASKLPIHLALRAALEASSAEEAATRLEDEGVAGSAHILLADGNNAAGLEVTVKGVKRLSADESGVIVHSNHLVLDHPGVDEPMWLQDSPHRLLRIQKLLKEKLLDGPAPTLHELASVLSDEDGSPFGINREQIEGETTIQTLFSIAMDLQEKKAAVTFGRPTEPIGDITLAF